MSTEGDLNFFLCENHYAKKERKKLLFEYLLNSILSTMISSFLIIQECRYFNERLKLYKFFDINSNESRMISIALDAYDLFNPTRYTKIPLWLPLQSVRVRRVVWLLTIVIITAVVKWYKYTMALFLYLLSFALLNKLEIFAVSYFSISGLIRSI